MIRYHARWVVPVSAPPVRDGWVACEHGRVVACGARGADAPAGEDVDLGDVALMPGLVNAHTHLELSHLRGRVPSGTRFTDWIGGVMASRRPGHEPTAEVIAAGIETGILESVAAGTALVGDISNTLATVGPLLGSPLSAVVFNELIKFNTSDPEGFVERACGAIAALPVSEHVRVGLAAHAPYSVGPDVWKAIGRAAERRDLPPVSIHLAESREEVEFIATGTGPWRTLLETIGAWNPSWDVPGVSPVQYLDDGGFLGARTIVVHGVQMTDADLATLAARRCTLVACPRSNQHTGAGVPPIARFYHSGVSVAVGTDSLASTADLSVFAELAEMRALAPEVPAAALVASATRVGAEALGFGEEFGTLEPGRRARMLAVRVPDAVAAIEDYLVSGIDPDQVSWVAPQ